jgi:hypothetical protein
MADFKRIWHLKDRWQRCRTLLVQLLLPSILFAKIIYGA